MSDAERRLLQDAWKLVGAASLGSLALATLGWSALDPGWVRDWAELTHGWLVVALAFMALCGGLLALARHAPAYGQAGLVVCAVAWAIVVLPPALQGAGRWLGPFGVLGLAAVIVWSMHVVSADVAAHQRSPAAAALELLASAGLLPWRGACFVARCFRVD